MSGVHRFKSTAGNLSNLHILSQQRHLLECGYCGRVPGHFMSSKDKSLRSATPLYPLWAWCLWPCARRQCSVVSDVVVCTGREDLKSPRQDSTWPSNGSSDSQQHVGGTDSSTTTTRGRLVVFKSAAATTNQYDSTGRNRIRVRDKMTGSYNGSGDCR
jgi:hypothetical protein